MRPRNSEKPNRFHTMFLSILLWLPLCFTARSVFAWSEFNHGLYKEGGHEKQVVLEGCGNRANT